MNWGAVAAICSLCGVLATIVSMIYLGATFAQKLRDNMERTDDHGVRLNKHSDILNNHEVRIAQRESWHEGYVFGARAPGKDVNVQP